MKKILSRPLFIFYILVLYIIIQFCWWAFHIINLEQTIYNLQWNSGSKGISDKVWMVVGEGSVFLLLLIAGAIITRNSFKKEVALGDQQKNFLLSVTHELKSPIASIKLYLETLLKRDFEKEKQKEILTNTIKETERLLSLVENILFSAKIESGTFSVFNENINISEFTKEILSIPIARDAGLGIHRFELSIEPGIYLSTDKTAYSSIVLNLVENAMKYSSERSKIKIDVTRKGGAVIFSIADEGPGIAENERENIFKKFYRIGNEDTRKTKGTGLGLYIVHFLVMQLGGTITVNKNPDSISGRGSIFKVTLPV